MNDQHPIRFIYDFLEFVDTVGIYDEFDEDENMMVTSDEVQALIEYARTFIPEPIENTEAAKRMRELTPEERDAYIGSDPEVVIDMRGVFAQKIAENGGARGILAKILEARGRGDKLEEKKLLADAQFLLTGEAVHHGEV